MRLSNPRQCAWQAGARPFASSSAAVAPAAAARRWRRAARTVAAAGPQQQQQQQQQDAAAAAGGKKGRLLYDAIALDMDGTLTKAHIDFVDMRKRTNIPVGGKEAKRRWGEFVGGGVHLERTHIQQLRRRLAGRLIKPNDDLNALYSKNNDDADLFVAMESWEEPDEVARAMGVILEIEAEAAATVSAMPGLQELLATLRGHDVKVALVTRNTAASVDAFFRLVGEEWRAAFDAVRTREFRFVKPDKRLLLSLAADLGARPGHVLMVGDSLEDVECGNAAGTASCLIAGGGNEVGASASAGPPPGAVPTLTVHSLAELNDILLRTKPAATPPRPRRCSAGARASQGARTPPLWRRR